MSDTRSGKELQEEIAETRADLADTAAALVAKTDVKAQVKQATTERTARLGTAAADVVDKAHEQVSAAADETRHQFTDGDAAEVARRPIPIAVVAAAAVAVAAVVAVVRKRRA